MITQRLAIFRVLKVVNFRGESRISGKGVGMYKGLGGSLCRFNLFFLKYPMIMK